MYWPPATGDTDDHGQPTYPDPRELRCRWEDSTEEQLDSGGNTFITKSVVYVEEELEELGVLWHGRLASANKSNPFANPGASRIRARKTLPDRKNKDRLRTVYL